jgi:hypothetical protein
MVQQNLLTANASFSRGAGGAAAFDRQGDPSFDNLVPRPRSDCVVRQPEMHEVERLWAAATAAVGLPIAEPSVIARVLAADPTSIWVFENAGKLTGGFAFLFLNGAGVEALQAGRLDTRDPPTGYLAKAGECPAGCYWWLGFRAPGPHGVGRVLEFLQGPRFGTADFWMIPYTEDGRRFARKMGFKPVESAACRNLYRYVRAANRSEPRDG